MPERAACHLPTLADVAIGAENLLAPSSFSVPNAVAYTNVTRENPEHGRHLEQEIYVPRHGVLTGVDLFKLPADASVRGGGDFVLQIDGALISEQYPPYFPQTDSHVAGVLSAERPMEEVTGEALLVARYGVFTWGHWLGELLPKIVLAELAHPGRFAFVLPYQVLADKAPNLPWMRLQESLLAYGIEDSRIISIHPDIDYQFSALFAVGAVWSNYLMHPGAMMSMRAQLQHHNRARSIARLAVKRIPTYGRELSNYVEIETRLLAHNFESETTGAMSFLNQVSIFQEAEVLFSTLGSDLTNLIFAREGVKVITVAPAIFGDRFFYALVLGRHGQMIDLRGPVTSLAGDLEHKSTFAIDPNEVSKALALFAAC